MKVWVDRFDTGLVDVDGTGGLFARVNGRTSAAVIAWLEASIDLFNGSAGGVHLVVDLSGYTRSSLPRQRSR